jgi:hypothetical protein
MIRGYSVIPTPATDAPIITAANAQFVANGGALSFTPTLTQGTGVTWTASGLPGWASINSSTGEITGTASTGGTTVKVTATNSAGSDTTSVRIVCHTSTANISSGDTFPLSLATANRKYTLTSDVTCDSTALIVAAANVAVDLDGHTITYDNAAQPTMSNTGFETAGGSATLAANWSASGSHILRTARTTVGLFGSWVMRATGYTGAGEYILSDAITLPNTNQQYQACVFCKGSDSTSVTIAIVDATTPSTVYASQVSNNANLGFAARVTWNHQVGDATSVKIKITPNLPAAAYIDLDFATLRRSGCVGIWATADMYDQWGDSIEDGSASAPEQLIGYTINAGSDFTLADTVGSGGVIQAGRSHRSHALYGFAAKVSAVGSYTLATNGMECSSIYSRYCMAGTLAQQVTCTGDQEGIQHRTVALAVIDCANAEGDLIIRGCHISGSGWTCISIGTAGATPIDNVLIEENNIIDWYSLGTDGYGIICCGLSNSTCRRNKIVAANGRGILIDEYGDTACSSLTIGSADETDANSINEWWGDPGAPNDPDSLEPGDGNYIEARERQNIEFPRTSLEATALRIRYYDDPHQNIKIIGNYFYAETDSADGSTADADQWVWAAFAARIGTSNSQTSASQYHIHNNTFKAIVLNSESISGTQNEAVSLCITSQGGNAYTEGDITNNTLETNHIAVLIGDNDAYGMTIGPVTMYDTEIISSSDGDQSLDFDSYRIGAWNDVCDKLTMVTTTYSGGATEAIQWGDPGGSTPPTGQEVDFANRITTHVTTSAPADISDASVTILNNQGVTVFSGSTDSSGLTTAATCPRISWMHNGTSASSVDHNPFDISASKSGYATNSDLNYSLSTDATRTIILSP